MPKSSERVLEKIAELTESAHIPAIGYACVEPKEDSKLEFESTSLTFGKKNDQSTDVGMSGLDGHTRFPASSLSKIVFTYLVLQLVKEKQLDLDEPLFPILQRAHQEYERFKIDAQYPEKATQITARHVLSHTTGLPNLGGSTLSPTVTFVNPESELGTGYLYSGEGFLYLQKVIETKMGKNLEELAKEYVFEPLGMTRSTFLPQPEDDTNVVAVHTQLGQPKPLYKVEPELCSAGSLLTTANDFSKFMAAWLENMDDPIIQQAFKPTSADEFPTCGLGWHICINKDTDEVIAYQYGENPNTRSFIAIDVKERKGAAFFTNSENGMSIATQILSSPDLAPIGSLGTMQALFKRMPHYPQSDEPGWKETIEGMIAEDQGKFEEARDYFKEAARVEKAVRESSPTDESQQQNKPKQLRLDWFNEIHPRIPAEKKAFTTPLETFVGIYRNDYNDEIEICIRDGGLIYKELGHEIKLVRVSETEFLPEKDQSIKISVAEGKMSIHSIDGWTKSLGKKSMPQSQAHAEAQIQYKETMRELRESQPGYMRSTESSRAKEREKYTDTAPKPPWKP